MKSSILRCSLFRQGFLVALKVGLRCLVFLVVGPIDRDFGSRLERLLQNLVGEEYSFSSHRIAFVFRSKNKEKFVEPLCLKNRSVRVSLDSIQTPEEDKQKESVY